MYVFAVFTNRNETLKYSSALRKIGVNAMVVSTPKGLGSSCSVSVKFYFKDLTRAIFVLRRGSFISFNHFFKLSTHGNMCNYEIIAI